MKNFWNGVFYFLRWNTNPDKMWSHSFRYFLFTFIHTCVVIVVTAAGSRRRKHRRATSVPLTGGGCPSSTNTPPSSRTPRGRRQIVRFETWRQRQGVIRCRPALAQPAWQQAAVEAWATGALTVTNLASYTVPGVLWFFLKSFFI